jgi:MFS family permease
MTKTLAQRSDGSLFGLDWLNFFLADVQTGVGPFLAIYLAANHWDVQQVGFVLAIGGIAGIGAQTPAGALIDRAHAKRTIVAVAVVCLVIGALVTAFFPTFWPIAAAQVLISTTSSVFVPALAAIALGIVGREGFDARQGRSQMFNSAGNVFAAVAMGLLGYYVSDRSIFFFVVCFAVPTLWSLSLIDPDRIDFRSASGCDGSAGNDKPARFRELLADKTLLLFLGCSVLFHFANAALLPLLGEMLSKGQGRSSMMFMSACVITSQVVISLIALRCGTLARSWGRKPLLMIAFAALPIRCILYTLTSNTVLLVSIQILDGVAAGIFGVVSTLVIADRTRGTGRFNLSLGAVATAVGIGAAISQAVVGSIVHHGNYTTGFLFCAAIASVAFVTLWMFMPETNHTPVRKRAGNSPRPAHLTS